MSKRKEYVLTSVLVVLVVLVAGFADEAPALAFMLMLPSVGLAIYLRFVVKEECE